MIAALRQKKKAGSGSNPAPPKIAPERESYFKRYLYRNYHGFAAIKYRLRRRVTSTGWMIVAATIVVAALGADTAVSLCYQSFAMLFCILVTSAICTPFGRPKIELRRILPRFGAVGEPLRYEIVARNISRRRENALALIEQLPDPRPTFREFALTREPGEEKRNWLDRTYGYYRWRWLLGRNRRAHIFEQPVPDLPGGAECAVPAVLIPSRRGILRLTGLTVACPDPFGLFRSLRTAELAETVLILPKRYQMPPMTLPGTVKYQVGGVSMASSVGESEEFVALREYRPGDALRRMHWKSYAKLGQPIVKEYQDEFFMRHALILDTFGAAADGEMFEEAVSVAASLAYSIHDQDSLLDLMFIGPEAYCFTSGRGLGDVEKVLEVLASVQVCEEQDFKVLEVLVREHAEDVSGCLCVFLRWDEDRQRLVKALLARGVPVRVFIIARPDDTPDPGPMAAQPENFYVLPIGHIAEKLASI